MTPFATSQQVETSMGRVFTVQEHAQVTGWLEEASDFVRDVAGGEAIYPRGQSTYTDWVLHGRIRVPFRFLVSVDAVTEDGEPVTYREFENRLLFTPDLEGHKLQLTVTTGLPTAPTLLRSYVIGMVEKRMTLTEMGVGVQFGGLSSVALEDFKVAFADGGDKAGFLSLPTHSTDLIRRRFGQTAWTVDSA